MPAGRKPQPGRDKRNQEMAARYAAGESTESLAAAFGLKRPVVINIMQEVGVRRADTCFKKRNETIVAERLGGKKVSEIAASHGLSAGRVNAILRKMNG
ncbi:hypothetical protein [Massilia sp. NP310]|uniref:hypothetical protein n=1 Tax=Massilia sp. NP310 TaxID=2861282 RepID=UPI001C62D890|nr:hypothetical protein [Massilia sp. NP310]QYG04034.1 hypothetical protein KY496_11950 [Massilia sp. NP310]